MPLLKRTILWTILLASIYFGGKMVQGSGHLAHGMGFMSMLVAAVCCYLAFRLMSGMISRYIKFALFIGIVLFGAYSIGLFGDKTWSSFLNGEKVSSAKNMEATAHEEDIDELAAEMFGPEPDVEIKEKNQGQAEDGGMFDGIMSFFGHGSTGGEFGRLNPTDYPAVTGVPNVKSSSILQVNGVYVKLLGIDGPDPRQKCADHRGNAYACGYEALTWLQNWLHGEPVTCHILGSVKNGRATGICFAGDYKYDVAAIVTKAGWAVAYTQNTDIYVAYEQQAAAAGRGLWQGTFYKPWDWRKIQNRKANIKVEYSRPRKRKKSGGWFDWKGLF